MYTIYAWSFEGTIRYIGLTKNLKQRQSRYLRKGNPSYKRVHSLRHIHKEMQKVFPYIPEFVILYNNIPTLAEARRIESENIMIYNTINNGFNKVK